MSAMDPITFVYLQRTKQGLWTSTEHLARDIVQVRQGVIAGYLHGEERWAELPDGSFLYGLRADGNPMTSADAQCIKAASTSVA